MLTICMDPLIGVGIVMRLYDVQMHPRHVCTRASDADSLKWGSIVVKTCDSSEGTCVPSCFMCVLHWMVCTMCKCSCDTPGIEGMHSAKKKVLTFAKFFIVFVACGVWRGGCTRLHKCNPGKWQLAQANEGREETISRRNVVALKGQTSVSPF